MFDVGDTVPLTFQTYGADGNPANAGSVVLIIDLPDDSTTTTAPITPTTAGVYTYRYPTALVGRYEYRWLATGANSAADTGVFEVLPADDETFISLSDAKRYLRIPDDVEIEDDLMRIHIQAACAVVEFLVGSVTRRTYTELYDGSSGQNYAAGAGSYYYGSGMRHIESQIELRHSPIISVDSIVEVYGNTGNTLTEVDFPDVTSNTFGFSVELTTGTITRRSGGIASPWPHGTKNVKVVYTAGRVRTPGNILMGTQELISHLWKVSQNNSEGRRPRTNRAEPATVIMGYAIPNRVLELLGADKQTPAIGG